MTPVTVDAGARNSYYSAGNIGWSARSLFEYRTVLQSITQNTTSSWGNANSSTRRAMSFTTPASSTTINEVRIPIFSNGSVADNVSLELLADSGASTPGSVVATADNVFAGSLLAASRTWVSFYFLTPVTLSASTKYWISPKRSGAIDAANFYSWANSNVDVVAGGRSSYNGSTLVWGAETAGTDMAYQVLLEEPTALYHLTQDTSLHMWRSTDGGATWTEQDNANRPTGLTATNPFSGFASFDGPFIGTLYFTATNTITAKWFNMDTNLWDTGTRGTTTVTAAASPERNIRLVIDRWRSAAVSGILDGEWIAFYTNLASTDDADLYYARNDVDTAAWTTSPGTAWLAATSADASMVSDVITDNMLKCGRAQSFYYDAANFDFSYRSLDAVTLSAGTEGDVSTAAADVETEQASATFEIYPSSTGINTAIIAFIDAAGTIQERIATLDLATPTFATDNAVTADTGAAGRQLTTCRFADVNYIFACDGSNIDMHESSTAGSWSSTLGHITGLTSGTLAQAIPVAGLGVLLAYTDNGDAKVEWVVVADAGAETFERTVTPVAHLIRQSQVRTIATVAHLIRQSVTRTVTPVAHRIRASSTRTVTPVAHFIRDVEARTVTPVAHFIRQSVTKTVTPVAHLIRKTNERTVGAAHRIRDIEERTVTPVAHQIRTTLTKTVATFHLIRDTETRTVTAEHRIVATLVRAITPVAHLIRVSLARSVTVSHLIRQITERTVAPAHLIRQSMTRTVTVAHLLIDFLERQVPVSHLIVAQVTRTVTPVAHFIRLTFTNTVTPVAHLIRQSAARTVVPAHRIRDTETRTITPVAHWIRVSLTRTVTPVAHRIRATSSRPVTVAHRIRSTASRTVLPSNLIRQLLVRAVTPVAHLIRQIATRSVAPAHRIRDTEIRTVLVEHRIAVGGSERAVTVFHLTRVPNARLITVAHLIDTGGGGGDGEHDTGLRGEILLNEQRRD